MFRKAILMALPILVVEIKWSVCVSLYNVRCNTKQKRRDENVDVCHQKKKKLGNCSQCASDLTSRCCHQIKLWRNWQDRCKSTSHQINSKYQYKSAHEFLCIIIQVNLFLVKAIISSSVCVFACCGGEGVSNAACTSIWQKMKSLNYHQTRWFMLVQAISLAQKISCSISWHAQSWTTY